MQSTSNEESASEERQSISTMDDRQSDSAADALVTDGAPADAVYYELKDVEDSPVGGHQEQVLKED